MRIRAASAAADFETGRGLIDEYLAWFERASGASLAEFQAELGEELADIAGWYAPPRGRLLLAEIEGEAVGAVGVHLMTPEVAELKRMYVRSEGRGHAAGRRLAERAIAEAQALGAREMWLTTLAPVMPRAVAIYEELGFRARPLYEGAGIAGILAMERSLLPGAAAKAA